MILYIDTSSLLKLYVEEAGFQQARELADRVNSVATSTLTYVEVRSALARKQRLGEMALEDNQQAWQDFERDWSQVSYVLVPVTEDLVLDAGTLAERRGLRALDAIHLASAIALARQVSEPLMFVTADTQLMSAAVQEGLATPS